jgi:type II secretory pathway component PulM
MTQWWDERSRREQAALSVLGCIIFAFVLFQFAIKPLISYRLAAKADHERAVELLAQIEADAREIQTLQASAAKRSDMPTRTVASMVASEQGLTITRVQPLENGDLDVWLDDVASAAVFRWVTALHERHGISVIRASLQKSDGGTVRAQITFVEGTEK